MPKSKYSEEQKVVQYTPTQEEQEKISYIDTRFTAMQNSRRIVEKDRPLYKKMIDAVLVPYKDGRSSSNVPLSSAIMELFVAETLKLQTDFQFRAETSKYKTQAKALEYVWNYDFRKNNRKKVFNENEYIAAWFGTSIIYTGFESYTKIQKDLAIDDNLEPSWEEVKIQKNDIIVSNIDIRDFYVDNEAISDFDEATDCILDQWMSFERFKTLSTNKFYQNVDKVAPRWYSTDNHSFTTEEERVKTGEYVRLRHYWNTTKDCYQVVANWVLVRDHPMITTIAGEKALPFTVRPLGKKVYSIYGRWFCEWLMMFASEINNLRELMMDALKRSNTQTLAIGNWLTFDWSTFSYDNEILTFDGTFNNNFQQISGNPPNQALFSQMLNIYKDIAIYIGIDIQNIIWQASQTAFQTEVQREASQKRVNVWLYNRDLAYERFANLYKDLLQSYFPLKTAEWVYPEIEIEWEEYKDGKFKKKKGKSTFQVTPETLRWDLFVDVYTNINAPTINVVDKQMKLDFMQAVWTISQSYAVAKQAGMDVDSVIPMKQTLRDLATMYNFEIKSDNDQEDLKEEKDKFVEQLKAMMPLQSNQQPWVTPSSQPMNLTGGIEWSEPTL